MKKSIFLSVMLFFNLNILLCQKWVISKQYNDDWGEPTGQRLIQQKVEGIMIALEETMIVELSRNAPSAKNFNLMVYTSNGKPYEYFDIHPVRVENGPPEKVLKKNPFMDPTTYPGAKVIENKFILKYKIDNIENSLYIKKITTMFMRDKLAFELDYSRINSILLSSSNPIKCIIAEELQYPSSEIENIIRFTLYPANYRQIIK